MTRARKGTGSITRRTLASGRVVFDVQYSYKDVAGVKRHTVKRGFTTQRDAQTFINKATELGRQGAHPEPGRDTVESYLTRYLDGKAGNRHAVTTSAGYRAKARLHVIPHIGKRQVRSIRGSDLTALYRTLETSGSAGGNGALSPASVRQVHELLSGMFRQAERDRLILRNPTVDAEPPTAKRIQASRTGVVRSFTADEVGRFLTATRDDRLGPLWRFLFTTGVRRGEALGLRWSDVDLEAGTARIEQTVTVANGQRVNTPLPKGGAGRNLDLDGATVDVLREHRKRQAADRLAYAGEWQDHNLVFCRDTQRLSQGGKPGEPLHGERVSRAFDAACKRAGVPDLRLHDVRHTWATLALRNGVSVNVVQERLGHAHPSITLGIYAHVQPGMDRAAAELVAGLF